METKKQISKSEAQDFRKRWKIVNTFEKEELRIIFANKKIEQLMTLRTSAKELGWTLALEGETGEVRD